MQLKCEECQQEFTKPPGWRLDETCPDCFGKTVDNFIKKVESNPHIDLKVHRAKPQAPRENHRQRQKLASVLDALNSEDEGTKIYGHLRPHRNLHACDNCNHTAFLPPMENTYLRECEQCEETHTFTRLEQ